MFGKLWSRTKALLSRALLRLFQRKPAEPGRFEAGTQSSFRGLLATAAWIWPQREYLVYVPQGHEQRGSTPLLVLVHGCRQTPEDIAAATRIITLADNLACLVLLPRQNPRANAWGCWNWFDSATASGWGETAIVAAQIEAVRRKYRIDAKRVFLAGLSSGGGLAAALALRRPDVVAGVFVHSGIACGAASTPQAALGVLKGGADTDFKEIAHTARASANRRSLPVPLCVIQGASDDVVAPVNASQLVRQYLVLNGHPAADIGQDDELPPPDHTHATTIDTRAVSTSEWRIANRLVARHVSVASLGHAWSGGDKDYAYTDPHGPDATALLGAFIRDAIK